MCPWRTSRRRWRAGGLRGPEGDAVGGRGPRAGAAPTGPCRHGLRVITPEHRAAAYIRKGQRAWGEIKATAAEQRALWLDVGTALAYGKDKANRQAGQKFSEWVQECFPGICIKNEVPAAIWLVSDFPTRKEIPAGLSYPCSIRKWFNEQQQQAPQAPAPDLTLESPSKLTASIEQVAPQAKRINKLSAMDPWK